MMELDRLNNEKGTATDAMVLFLALNTSGLALLPLGVISLRAAAGSQDAAGIMATTWFASGCATRRRHCGGDPAVAHLTLPPGQNDFCPS